MDLIKLTFRLHNGGVETRLGITALNMDHLEQFYLQTIPGAVFCLKTTAEKNISKKRADKVMAATLYNLAAFQLCDGVCNESAGRH